MSDNIEIVMDIDSLEIFDVIDLDKNEALWLTLEFNPELMGYV